MIKYGKGGANTKTGLIFAGKVDLATFLSRQQYYRIEEWTELMKKSSSKAYKVFFKEKEVAKIFQQNAIYKYLETFEINWKELISKKLLPDDSIFVTKENTVFIIEIKHQSVEGSVDEKLQTCDFKKKQWQKILSRLNWNVEYWYLLDKWFDIPKYKDVLDYIISVRCRYFFNYIPLKDLGLPQKNDDE